MFCRKTAPRALSIVAGVLTSMSPCWTSTRISLVPLMLHEVLLGVGVIVTTSILTLILAEGVFVCLNGTYTV